jgi:hypothetical protein
MVTIGAVIDSLWQSHHSRNAAIHLNGLSQAWHRAPAAPGRRAQPIGSRGVDGALGTIVRISVLPLSRLRISRRVNSDRAGLDPIAAVGDKRFVGPQRRLSELTVAAPTTRSQLSSITDRHAPSPAQRPADSTMSPGPAGVQAVSTDIVDFRVRVDVSVTNTRLSVGS